MRNIHHDLWAQTFSSVPCNVTKSMTSKANCEPKDYRINIIDASTISLCLGNIVIIVTNDFSLDALEITEIYRLRWQVELFFNLYQPFNFRLFTS